MADNGERSVEELCQAARQAARTLQASSTEQRNSALRHLHDVLERRREDVQAANRKDKQFAAEKHYSEALRKRLELEGAKFDAMLESVQSVLGLEEPVNRVTRAMELVDGLKLYRVTCPIGVICVIFEARPEAAVQIASLCIKSGNALLLKGGKEAANSNAVLVQCVQEALHLAELPQASVQLVATREQINELLKHDRLVDLIIPRGSNELVRNITESTRIPVLGHSDGVCAVYVDRAADADKAVRIVTDAKAQYVAVCNAAETLLVHADVAHTLLPRIGASLARAGVKMRADESALAELPEASAKAATPEDFDTEFLEHTIAVKVVDSLEDAVEHINKHGSSHTDAIVTEDAEAAEKFLARVDSANVYHNASTRFADGFRYGFGAEVGVSTTRTHSRGPVGVEGLMIYKYRLYGDGHTVGGMQEDNQSFSHRTIEPELPKL